jgi:tetratricopeptide (TPR) repeat protein
MRLDMDNEIAARARRKKGSQLGLLYAVAFVITLVPHTLAWSVPSYLERRAARQQAEVAEEAARITAQLESVTGQAHDALLHNRLDQAIAAADQVLALEPTWERAQAVKANAFIERFWVTKADADLEQARRLVALTATPGDAQTFAAIANLALIDKDPAQAVALLGRAAEIAPADAYVQHQYAFALNQSKRPDEALPHYVKAITIAPDMAWVNENLQEVLAALGRCEEKIPRLKPETIAGCSDAVGVQHYNAGRFTEARRLFERAVALAPANGVYHANLAIALLRFGRQAQALEEGRQARALGVKEHPIFEALGIR